MKNKNSKFFSKINEIQKNEIGVKLYKNVLNDNLIKKLEAFSLTLKAQVDRPDSKKSSFNFSDNETVIELKEKLDEIIGEFYINDFKPHFITSRFPLRIHADTGKDPEDIIGQNILIPISINPINKKAHTIIFKNKWYGPSANFVSKKNDGNDHILKDEKNKLIEIDDIKEFYSLILKQKINSIYKFNQGEFLINSLFIDNISKLLDNKRYGIRTNEHIIKGIHFDKKIYNRYLTHIPYDDLEGLEVHTIYKWNIGDIISWDRSFIHCSDNFLSNDVIQKISIPIFTSKINKPFNKL